MTTIAFPFRIDEHGRVASTRNPDKVNLDRVRAVLNTQLGDRPMRPDFGTNISNMILDIDRTADANLKGVVSQAFKEHLPDLHLVNTRFSYTAQDRQTGTLLVEFNGPNGNTDVATVAFVDGIVASDPNLTSEVNL